MTSYDLPELREHLRTFIISLNNRRDELQIAQHYGDANEIREIHEALKTTETIIADLLDKIDRLVRPR